MVKRLFTMAILLLLCLSTVSISEAASMYALQVVDKNAYLNSMYSDMSIEELEQADLLLHDVLNAKRVGSAKLTFEETQVILPVKANKKMALTCDFREITSNTEIVYETADETVATVKSGRVTAVGEGTTQIKATATFEDGGILSAECTVVVYVPVASVKAPESSVSLFVGEEYEILPQIAPENATEKGVLFESDNPEVLSVDQKGVVTAKQAGKATVVMTSAENTDSPKSGKMVFTVEQQVVSIQLDRSEVTTYPRETVQLTPTLVPQDANNTKVEWSSSDPSVATVDSKGVVQIMTYGTATITCQAADGQGAYAVCTLTILDRTIDFKTKWNVVQMGKDGNGKPYEWIVLTYNAASNRAFLLSKDGVGHYNLHDGSVYKGWSQSPARKYLNGKFLESTFSSNEKNAIIVTNVSTPSGWDAYWGTGSISGGPDTKDRLFLLSEDEVTTYLPQSSGYRSLGDSLSDSWWTRSPGPVTTSGYYVNWDGVFDFCEPSYSYELRPAMWVDLEALQ